MLHITLKLKRLVTLRLALLVSCVVPFTPTISPAEEQISVQSAEQIAIMAFILSDLEFTLKSAPATDVDPTTITKWLDSTNTRLNDFNVLAGELHLNSRVNDSTAAVRRFLGEYRGFLRDLKFVDYVVDARLTEGDGTWRSGVGITLNALKELGDSNRPIEISAGFACLSLGSDGFSKWDDKYKRESLEAKLKTLSADFVETRRQVSLADHKRCLQELQTYSASLSGKYRATLPTFVPRNRGEEQQNEENLFTMITEAYNVCSKDRAKAAKLLLKAAEAVPPDTKVTGGKFAAYYKAPLMIMASHLYAFESRYAGEGHNFFCNKSVELFDRAMSEVNSDYRSAPYPYLISYAESLATLRKNDSANRIAAFMEESLPQTGGDTILLASRLYDLACLHGILGDDNKALEFLAKSFQAEPRRDPGAMQDPRLSTLWTRHSATVRSIVDQPLVGGEWQSVATSDDDSIMFYPGGSLWQKRYGKKYHGFWSVQNDELKFTNRTRTTDSSEKIPDSSCSLTVSDANRIQLTFLGTKFDYIRGDRSLLQGYSRSDVAADESGVLTLVGNQPVHFGRLSTNRLGPTAKRKIWYSYQHPITGRIDSVSVVN